VVRARVGEKYYGLGEVEAVKSGGQDETLLGIRQV
jgi:hypothetical protein